QALDLVERAREALRIDRLQQIVDRVGLERAQRVRVVRGREDNERRSRQLIEEIESGQAGHLDVEKEDVDAMLVQKGERLLGIGRGACNLHGSGRVQHPAQTLNGEPLVVYDICVDHEVMVRPKADTTSTWCPASAGPRDRQRDDRSARRAVDLETRA